MVICVIFVSIIDSTSSVTADLHDRKSPSGRYFPPFLSPAQEKVLPGLLRRPERRGPGFADAKKTDSIHLHFRAGIIRIRLELMREIVK